MAVLRETATFNRPERFAEGWYWALPSRKLRRGRVQPVTLLGRELAIYRGEDGLVRALDAYCPHMGAHLAEGKVQGDSLRCFFHDWKFAPSGECLEVPALAEPPQACVKAWPCEEKYGMVWVWTGPEARVPVPFVPELEGMEVDALLGNRFEKACHPNVVMINAIDAHHFNTVHNLPVELEFATRKINPRAMTFENTTRVPESSLFTRLISRFYEGPLTYKMCYWFGSTGSVTVGPDFMHFHIIFALRALEGGRTEGQTILVTKRRGSGPLAWLFNRVALLATKVVGDYFAKGDTQVFQTIKFDFKTPTRADRSIIDFIQDVDAQPARSWGDWRPVASAPEPQAAEQPRDVIHV